MDDVIYTPSFYIKLIDNLLSSGWTSLTDMNIVINDCTNSTDRVDRKGKSPYEFYKEVMFQGGCFKSHISQAINRMVDAWALIRRGVDIEGILEKDKKENEKKEGRKKRPSNPIREEFRNLFIESKKLNTTDSDEDLAQYNLSEATLYRLRNDTEGQGLSIFRYIDREYSILDDLKEYELKYKDEAKLQRKVASVVNYDISDAERYGFIPDPDVIARKRRLIMIRALQVELLNDTTGAVKKRLEAIEIMKKKKLTGWMGDTSETYLNAIYDGRGIIESINLGPIIHQYGAFLMDGKEYGSSQTFLKESLDTIKESMLSGGDLAKEEYALILQNLSALHSYLGNYLLAEAEAVECLSVFRQISKNDSAFNYGVAISLYTLAGVHVNMKKWDSVEEEYDEAVRLFSPLSEIEPTKYLYMLVECISALAKYYYLVGKNDDCIEAFERAMPFWGKLTEKNFDDFAPNKVNAMINYALALQDNGRINQALGLLNEAIDITRKLNERSPEVYNEELSTAFQNRGIVNAGIGEMGNARKDLEIAEEIRRKLVEQDPRAFNIRLAATLDSLANLDFMAGASENAISKWNEAISLLSIYDTEGNTEQSSSFGKYYSSIGMIYLNRGDKDNAFEYYTKAEAYYRRVFDKNSSPKMFEDNFALTLSYLGLLYGSNEDTQGKAESYFEESLDIALWLNSCAHSHDHSYLVLICCNYAPFLFNQGRYVEAKRLWEQAVSFGEANNSHLLTEQELQLLDLARENIHEAEYRIEHPEEEYLDDEISDEEDIAGGEDSSRMAVTKCSPEEAMQAIESAAEEIAKLNKEDVHYRIKCNDLYRSSLKYCASAPDSLYLADYLTSMCQFLTEGYLFSPVLDIAPIAKNIYEGILGEDNANMKVRLKYIELLSSYCRALDEYNHNDELYTIIDSAYKLLTPINIDEGDDIGGTYAALKNELLYDYIYRGNPEEEYKQAKYILMFYRRVSSPNKSLMCRFLTKAAESACEMEAYEDASRYIEDTETCMRDCNLDDMGNCLSLGVFYAFKGRFLRYLQNDVKKTFEAFDQSQAFLEKGIDFNPAAFKCELLVLYRSRLVFLRIFFTMYLKEEQDLCKQMIELIDELTEINEYVFAWRNVEAYLEIVEVLKDIYFSNFYKNYISLDELEEYCTDIMSMYSHMETILAIYRKTDPSIYSDYISKVFDGKKELKEDLRATKE